MAEALIQTLELKNIPLGQKVPYPESYAREYLHPIERAPQRRAICMPADLPMHGGDIWNCYELAWCNAKGKPERALGSFLLDASSPFLPESKSVKLYFNGLNHCRFNHASEFVARVNADLSEACLAPVELHLNQAEFFSFKEYDGYFCLDDLDVEISVQRREPRFLAALAHRTRDRVYTKVFKSHCLVTGQPDWGAIYIDYEGQELSRENLFKYLMSFCKEPGFSENMIEQIYLDLYQKLNPSSLTVLGRFSRRGGIDINPYRSSSKLSFANNRAVFQ